MSDLLTAVWKHAESLYWVERLCYLADRGWRGRFDPDLWISPHDGAEYPDSIEPMVIEMLLEIEGRPTPRSGDYIDTRRGETKHLSTFA